MGLIVGLIVLACLIVLLGIVLRISAAILRGAVGLTNAVLGGREPHEDDFRRPAYDNNPLPRPKSLAGIRVPMPEVGYAILINILIWVATAVTQALAVFGTAFLLAVSVQLPADPFAPESLVATLAVLGAGIAAGLLTPLVVLKMALPTTFLRAVVVVFWQHVIAAVLCGLLFLAVYALAPADGVRLPARPSQANVWFR